MKFQLKLLLSASIAAASLTTNRDTPDVVLNKRNNGNGNGNDRNENGSNGNGNENENGNGNGNTPSTDAECLAELKPSLWLKNPLTEELGCYEIPTEKKDCDKDSLFIWY
jgi:hypothetical protein